MRVLVLGASTLVGNNVLRAAVKAGWQAVVFMPPQKGRRRNHHQALEDLPVEITPGKPDDLDALRQAMAGCDVVFHTSPFVPPNGLHHQPRLTEARQHIELVLQAAEQATIGRLVFSSSVSTIGRSDVPTRHPDEWNHYRLGSVSHPYWDAMLVQEEAVLAFGRRTRTPVVVTNLSQVMGPFDFSLAAAGALVEMAKRGIRRYLPGRISIADVRDVAQGQLAAATQGRPGERYILAGHNLERRQMMATMASACKRLAPDHAMELERYARMAHFSERVSCFGRPNRPFPLTFQIHLARNCQWYSSGKAREELGYHNRPLLNTYRATLKWLQEIKVLKQVK